MGNKVKVFLALLAAVAVLLAGAGNALAQDVPPIPADYSGYVYVGGAKAGASLQVSAKLETYTSDSVTTDANGFYFFLVVGPSDAAYAGKTIHFYVNGADASETSTFAAGSRNEDFALNIAALPADGGGGGGGAAGGGGTTVAPDVIEVIADGQANTYSISDQGEILNTITATSADGNLTLSIPDGTIALDKYGNRLSSLTVDVDPSPPSPPKGVHVIGLAYDFEPNGATFDPPITLEYTYDPADIPQGLAEEDLVLAYYNEEAGEWVELPSTVDPVTNAITASVSHFTIFAIIARAAPPPLAPAAVSVSNLSIQPAEVKPKEAVTIMVSVANTGGTEGSYTVVLMINGVKEAEKRVTIAAGRSQNVSFTVSREDARSYSVVVDGLSGSFTVLAPVVVPAPAPAPAPPAPPPPPAPPAPPAPINWPLIGGIIAAMIVVALLIYFLVVRRILVRG